MGADVESTGMGQADTSPEDSASVESVAAVGGIQGPDESGHGAGGKLPHRGGELGGGQSLPSDAQGAAGVRGRARPAGSPDLDGSRGSDGRAQTVAQQMETLAWEVAHLGEMVEAQGVQLQELGRRVAGLEDVARGRTAGDVEPDEGGPANGVHRSGSRGCPTQGS